MKKTTFLTILSAASLANFAFADMLDFGSTTEPTKDGGIEVTGVFQNTPAASLGLEEGDVITKINELEIQGKAGLAHLVNGLHKEGDEIKLEWTRGGEAMSGTANLNKTIPDAAFHKKYATENPTSFMKVVDVKELKGGNLEEKLKNLDVEDLKKQLMDQLEEQGLGGAGGINLNTMVQMSTILTSPTTGNKINFTKSGEEKRFTIESKAGEVLFDDVVTEENLDKVPEADREFVKSIHKNGINAVIMQGARKKLDEKKEESLKELMDKIEK